MQLRFDRLPVALRRQGPGNFWVGLAAVGRREQDGPREVLVLGRHRLGHSEMVRRSLPVEIRPYPVDRLRVPAQMATPPVSVRPRVYRESAARLFGAGLASGGPSRGWSSPVSGARTSSFGATRYFNGIFRGPHLGVDLRAWTGTPILAPVRGRVAFVGKEYLGGLTVRVDHGDGWISHYMHLSKSLVKPGQRIHRGEKLAEAGATGRVTGPHLHWAVTWRGRYMDPSQLLKLNQPLRVEGGRP
jgi:murein DD-endopeptidase MepM/ murein hydrolase activator NlpD